MKTNKVLGKLKKEQFYYWRFSVENMRHAETQTKLEERNLALLAKEIEITQLRVALYKNKIGVAQNFAKEAQAAYHKAREEIEKTLGFTLKDTVVDEVTFEVKELEG